MKQSLMITALGAALFMTPLGTGQGLAQEQAQESRTVSLKNNAGETVGTIVITPAADDDGVLIQLDAENLPEGAHGFHIHEKADCSPDESFVDAGSHFTGDDDAGDSHVHGFLLTDDPHAGDMPNIHVHEDGTVKVDIFNTKVSLGGDDDDNLLDGDGSAFMIHARPDDYRDVNSAGPRIACGELE